MTSLFTELHHAGRPLPSDCSLGRFGRVRPSIPVPAGTTYRGGLTRAIPDPTNNPGMKIHSEGFQNYVISIARSRATDASSISHATTQENNEQWIDHPRQRDGKRNPVSRTITCRCRTAQNAASSWSRLPGVVWLSAETVGTRNPAANDHNVKCASRNSNVSAHTRIERR